MGGNMKFVVLAVVLAAASVEAYASGYASSTPAPTPTPTPAPAPTPAVTTAAHYVSAEVEFTGMTKAQFETAANINSFKEVVSTKLGVAAGDVYDVVATDVTRRSSKVKVSFKVKVANAAAATSGASTLTTFLSDTTSNGFLSKLKTKAQSKGSTAFNSVTVRVTKAPKAGTTVTVSSVSKSAAVSITSVLACGLLAFRH